MTFHNRSFPNSGLRDETGHSRRDVLRYGVILSGAALVPAAISACGSNGGPTPMPSVPTQVSNTQQIGDLLVALAKNAAANGTYGIGGAIIENSSGRVVKTMENSVLKRLNPDVEQSSGEVFTWDPTAHGERELVYWYYANKAAMNLPPTQQLTVVTSLDPCAMCAGTLLTAGFNVGVVAPDTFSGINYNQQFNFPDLPEPVRGRALATFGYYAVDGGRAYVGGKNVVFSNGTLSASAFSDCSSIYQQSATGVRQNRKNSGTQPAQLENPAKSPDADAVRTAYKAQYAGAFSLTLANYRKPNAALKSLLIKLRDSTPGAKNAVAFIDPFGNLISAFADSFDKNPVATAFQNVAQSYSQTRFNLLNNQATNAIVQKTITSPKYGTFVFLYAPSPRLSTTIEDLGAFGSTVESKAPTPIPSPFQFYLPPLVGTTAELQKVAHNLPPLYSQLVDISPQQVHL